MRILIATGLYPPEIGGPATYSKLLHDELPKRGIQVDVLPFSEVRHLPKLVRHIVYFFKVLIRGRSADLIYAQDPVSVGLPASFAARLLHKPFFLKIVGDYAWEQGKQRFGVTDMLDDFSKETEGYHSSVLKLKQVQTSVANRAERIIVPSGYLKKIVVNWGVPEEKIVVIHNGFTPPETIDKEHARDELDISGTTIVSVGRLVPWKGFDTLIGLFPEIKEQFPNAKLIILGDGPEREALELRTRDLGLRTDIIFTGQVPHDTLLKYLAAADCFVLNTAYEGLSHVILEAMAEGAPVVTTDVGGNPELITDKKNGLLVPYNDKEALTKSIVSVLKEESFREKLTRNARARIEDFSQEKMLSRTAEILKH